MLALFGASVSSCSEQEETDISPLLSDTEITFSLSEWTPIVQSRAATYRKNDDLTNPQKGGGNFTLYAYVDNKLYIDGKRGWYHETEDNVNSGKWYMLGDDDLPRTYYWPNTGSVDFFAYMPDSAYNIGNDGYVSKPTYVKIQDGYSEKDGKTFWCALPEKVCDNPPAGSEYVDLQEFIYAYVTNQKKQTEPVELKFEHPFALINFKLGTGSYRMTINEFKLEQIYLNGTFSTKNRKWEPIDSKKKNTYITKINKRVPNDINYNSELSDGGFIVIPQSIGGVKLTMSVTRDSNSDTSDSNTNSECSFTFIAGNGYDCEWKPGYKYTYTIHYGDNKEEIYFNVETTKWDNNDGYKQDIDVE